MEVQGAAFLYTLTTLSVTFAGFAALLLILRQAAGGSLNALDRFLARTVVGHLFMIMGGALLPPMLALFGLPMTWVWRISGLVFGLPMLALLLTYQKRRVAATGKAAPWLIVAVFVIAGPLSIVAMLVYVFAGFAHPAGAYAATLGFNFLLHAFAFVIALDVIFRQSGEGASGPG